MTRPEVLAMLATVVVAVLGALAALAGLAKRWADRQFAPIQEGVAAVRYQAENEHGPSGKDVNLRDQLDEIQAEMRDGFKRMDHSFGEVHDRQQAEVRDRQALAEDVKALEKRASVEHAALRAEINKISV
jgi:hypothetical protein